MSRENAKNKAPPPFSLRLTFEERARLEKEAGDRPLGEYIRERLFGDDVKPRKTRTRRPVQDQQELAQVLAKLGQSRLASSLNQLARASHLGTLPTAPETDQALQKACSDVAAMRSTLCSALGLRLESGP